MTIAPEERGLAVIAHLSGLAGYIVPLGGILVPVIIWFAQRESAVVSTIAKQAILLNVVVFVLFIGGFTLWLTIILIPLVVLFWIMLGIAAVVIPVIGAVKASAGNYYKYPVVGIQP